MRRNSACSKRLRSLHVGSITSRDMLYHTQVNDSLWVQETRQSVTVELAAFADARPRNLYLFGLFVADHQLPETEALPAPPELATLPAPPEAALPAPLPAPTTLPAAASSVGTPPAGAESMPASEEHSATASLAAPTAQQAAASPSLPRPPSQPSQEPASQGVAASASPAPLSEVEVMEYLVGLLEQPPYFVDNDDARLSGLRYEGTRPQAERRLRLVQDLNALLEEEMTGNRKVWKLRPQVRICGGRQTRPPSCAGAHAAPDPRPRSHAKPDGRHASCHD